MPAWIIPAAIAAGQLLGGLIGQGRQNKANKRLAAHQASINEAYLQQQLEYNTPKNQMARYQQAGLNPNLIYGQGNPGNQSAPLSAPDQRTPDYQTAYAQIGQNFNQAMMVQSQVQAIDAGTRQKYVLTRLNELQAQVLARNPALQDSGFSAIMESLKSSAEIKASESKIKGQEARLLTTQDMKTGLQWGEQKFLKELDLLDQKFNLGQLDKDIKVQVLNSKEFQNALLEIQKRWMSDGEITPQHILQFVQLLLMKLL